jgi:hypothetical protein
MVRRLFTLVGVAFYGTVDRIASLLLDDASYPDERDPLATARTTHGAASADVDESGVAMLRRLAG